MKQQNALTKLSKMFKDTGVTEAKVTVSSPKRNLTPNLEFVMTFPKILRKTIESYNLTMAEFKTLLALLELLEYSNLTNVNQVTIANYLGSSKQNINKHFKKFRELGILFEDESGFTWVNPALFAKGKLWDFKENSVIYKEVEKFSNNLELDKPPF